MNETIFRLEDITFAYPECEPVLKNFNLNIKNGECLSILGANGCGKSTLLKILAGLIFPTNGTFTAFNKQIDEKYLQKAAAVSYHRKVGFVFQDSEVQLFCSTVYEELAFGPMQIGLSQQVVDQRIHELARILNIEKLLDKAPFHLSGGEKKKVALGSTLIINPDVLLLDEPANTLDPRTQAWLTHLLLNLTQSGKTIILATHDLNLAPAVSKRAILLNESHQIIEDMPTNQLLQRDTLLKKVNLVGENYQPPM